MMASGVCSAGGATAVAGVMSVILEFVSTVRMAWLRNRNLRYRNCETGALLAPVLYPAAV